MGNGDAPGGSKAVAPGQVEPEVAATGPRDIADLGIIGGVLLVVCAAVVVAAGRPKSAEFFAFVFLAGLAPPIAATVLYALRNAEAALVGRLFLLFSMAGALTLGVIELALRSLITSRLPILVVMAVSIAASVTLSHSPVVGRVRRHIASGAFDVALLALFLVIVCFFSPLDPVPRTFGIFHYLRLQRVVLLWVVFGAALVFVLAALRSLEGRLTASRRRWGGLAMLAVFFVFVLFLFDDELYLNVGHYLVHVGPAMHSLHGGIAMVDVYCIYGMLPWMVVKAALVAIAPTFGAAALAVRLSMLAYYAAIGVTLYAVARHRITALLLLIPFMLVAVTFHPGLYNLNGLPSTTGLRYLVPALMVAVLTAVRSPVWSGWLAAGLLVIASLWSIEAFVYTLGPWGYLLFLRTVSTRSILVPGATLVMALVAVILAHVAFIYGTYYSTGLWPDYGPYFGLVQNFRPDKAGFWAQPLDPNFATWIAAWFGLFLVLAVAGYRALLGRPATDTCSRIVPVAVLGFAELNYFAGYPAWSSLGLAFLPVGLVIICCIEALSERRLQYGRVGAAALFLLSGLAAVLIAFGAERFARTPLYDQGNRTVLRRCFTEQGCALATIPENLQRGLYASPLDPNGPVYASLHDQHPVNMPPWFREDSVIGYERLKEVVGILRALPAGEEPIGILADTQSAAFISVAALMETGRWYKLPLSSPLNDDISPGVTALVLNAIAKSEIHDGEMVILSNTPSDRDRKLDGANDPFPNPNPEHDRILAIEEKMLAAIKDRCRLVLTETHAYNSVYRTTNCRTLADHVKRN